MGVCGSFILVLTLPGRLGDMQLLGLVGSHPLPPPGRQRLHEIASGADEHGEDDGDGASRLIRPRPGCS